MSLIKKFLRDSSANVVITTALMLPILLGAAAVSVDLADMYRARVSYQAAVDAAALAAAKVYMATNDDDDAEEFGIKVFNANAGDAFAAAGGTIDIDTSNCDTGDLVATANVNQPLYFGAVHNVFSNDSASDHATMTISAAVNCGGGTYEFALVIDNSENMNSNGKLAILKDKAKRFVQSVHHSKAGAKWSVIPYAAMVNIGSDNKNEPWMDRNGLSSVHNEHLDWASDPNATQVGNKWETVGGDTLSRFKLYDELGISWEGCVEQRPYPHHTLDTEPTSSNPDTLFVPSFAPDTPDNYSGQLETTRTGSGAAVWCTQWERRRPSNCKRWSDGERGSYHPTEGYANRYDGSYDPAGNYVGGGSYTTGSSIVEETYQNNYLEDAHNISTNRPHQYDPTNTGIGVKQYSRQRWTWKYFNNPTPRDVNDNTAGLPTVDGVTGGPNMGCTPAEVLPLTKNLGWAVSKIETMSAEGGSNLQQGIAWGWRALSSAEPFSDGLPESAPNNNKVMIIMASGNNSYIPSDYHSVPNSTMNPAYYGAFGHNGGSYASDPLDQRLFDNFDAVANPANNFNTNQMAMNEHMLETCENAKANGIKIFAITLDVANGSNIKDLLDLCVSKSSGGEPLYIDAPSGPHFEDGLNWIASKLSELSLTR